MAAMTTTPPATPPAIGPATDGLFVGCAVWLVLDKGLEGCVVLPELEGLPPDVLYRDELSDRLNQDIHLRIGYTECCVENIKSCDVAHGSKTPVTLLTWRTRNIRGVKRTS